MGLPDESHNTFIHFIFLFLFLLGLFLEKAMTRFSLPHDPPVQILLEDQSDTVLAAGQSYLNTYNFQNHKTVVEICTTTVNDYTEIIEIIFIIISWESNSPASYIYIEPQVYAVGEMQQHKQ